MFRSLIALALLLAACADSPQPDPNAERGQTTNNATNNATNNQTNNNTVAVREDTIETRCQHYCDILFGRCVSDVCTLPDELATATAGALAECTSTGPNGCIERYDIDIELKEDVDERWDQDCNTPSVLYDRCYKYGFDACGCPVPKLGEACSSDSDCYGGLLADSCNQDAGDGLAPGGHCIVLGCDPGANAPIHSGTTNDHTGCGAKNPCLVYTRFTQCFPACESSDDCREGYTCLGLRDGNAFCGILL